MPGTRVVSRAPLYAAVAVFVLTPGLRAQGVEYVKGHYTKAEYQVPMRDGVRLFTAVYTPKDTSRDYPILLARTQSGTLEAHHCFQADRANNVLVMGPWIHGGWSSGTGASLGPVSFGSNTAEYFREAVELPFFNFHLKGKGELKLPNVLAFETGTNRWRPHASWPPQGTRPMELYFEAGSRLATEPPRQPADTFDEYVSDPAKPVPYSETISTVMAPEYMCADQRFAARRSDVLVYEGEGLSKPVTLAGPIEVELHVSTTGTDSDKLAQLKIVESETMKLFGEFLGRLKRTKEDGVSLLDQTMVFLGSNLGNGSSHSTKNLPVILAGGGFKHGQHLAFDPKNHPPLYNLYVTMLQRLGIEADKFGSSTGALTGVETVG
jgi:predicted acyl esterase